MRFGDFCGDYLELFLKVRVVDPEIKAAALQGIVNLPGTIGGNHHEGRCTAWYVLIGNGYLEISQQLQEEAFKLLVRPVQLVDE